MVPQTARPRKREEVDKNPYFGLGKEAISVLIMGGAKNHKSTERTYNCRGGSNIWGGGPKKASGK